MVSNVTKKTFFSKFFKLNFLRENLSLKQLIQKALLDAIALYEQQYPKVNNWQQIKASLSEKIILCYPQISDKMLGYRCAIAFPIGHLVNLSPLLVAEQLVILLPSQSNNQPKHEILEIAVTILEPGWIDFYLCNQEIFLQNQDQNLCIWLEQIMLRIIQQNSLNYPLPKKGKKLDKLFPFQYIYGRCTSLLKLGERQGLIILKTKNMTKFQLQIQNPFPFKWCNYQGKFCLITPQEWDLLRLICLMLDDLAENKEDNLEHWSKFTKSMSEVWLRFISNCPFCGEVSQENPQLATARLGLIFLTYYCLETILIERLAIIPDKDI
jgi:hypothetical protein